MDIPVDRLDTEILLAHVLKKDRTWLMAHPNTPLSENQHKEFDALIRRRKNHEPIAYIIGEKEFYGRPFFVDKHVLIPRPSTEGLIDLTLQYIRKPQEEMIDVDSEIVVFSKVFKDESPQIIVDIGTGSGCIAITIALECPELSVIATDISKSALGVAKDNAEKHKVIDRIQFLQGNLLDPLQDFDQNFLLVSNPPYVPSGDIPMRDVRDYEPKKALFAGPDGMDVLSTLFLQAQSHPYCIGCILESREEQAKKLIKQS
jgi:release factor glutamine methyltransferase